MSRRAGTAPGLAAALLSAVLLAGCSTPHIVVRASVPQPLIAPLPLTVGVRLPDGFAAHVQKEEVSEGRLEIEFGPAQAEAMRRIAGAMFQTTVPLGPLAAGENAALPAGVHASFAPSLDSYVFVLPSENAAEYYSATIGYKVEIGAPDGTLLGSWVYEGYGSVPARSISRLNGINRATALAIRDACANIAVNLPRQEIVRNLLAPPASGPSEEVKP